MPALLTLLSIYGLTILAAVLLAAGLAALGAHIAARDKAMQTMCISQGAMLGVITGIGLSLATDHSETTSAWLPFLTSAICCALTFGLTERILRQRHAAKTTVLVTVFALLLAAGYLTSALFPGLETHMTQRYIGDLATMSHGESLAALGMAVFLLATLTAGSRRMLRDSFNTAILGQAARLGRKDPSAMLFSLLTVGVIAASVQLTGFLFTTTCLFLPTTWMSFSRQAGTTRHLRLSMTVAAVGTGCGFFFSLYASKLPTVPTIAAAMALTGLLLYR